MYNRIIDNGLPTIEELTVTVSTVLWVLQVRKFSRKTGHGIPVRKTREGAPAAGLWLWLGWAYLTKKVPSPHDGHAHRHRLQILYWTQENGVLNRLRDRQK